MEWNTLIKRTVGIFSSTLRVDMLDIQGCVLGPYAGYKFSVDVQDRPWSQFGEIEGGFSMRTGPLQCSASVGYRGSFNGGTNGTYMAGRVAIWSPLIRGTF